MGGSIWSCWRMQMRTSPLTNGLSNAYPRKQKKVTILFCKQPKCRGQFRGLMWMRSVACCLVDIAFLCGLRILCTNLGSKRNSVDNIGLIKLPWSFLSNFMDQSDFPESFCSIYLFAIVWQSTAMVHFLSLGLGLVEGTQNDFLQHQSFHFLKINVERKW